MDIGNIVVCGMLFVINRSVLQLMNVETELRAITLAQDDEVANLFTVMQGYKPSATNFAEKHRRP